MYHKKINVCDKNFSSKKGFCYKNRIFICLKKKTGGGGEVELRMWWDFSGELIPSSNTCLFQFLKIHLNTTCNKFSAGFFGTLDIMG